MFIFLPFFILSFIFPFHYLFKSHLILPKILISPIHPPLGLFQLVLELNSKYFITRIKIIRSEFLNFQSLRPFFDGNDYPHWKYKIELYLDSDPIKLWDVVLQGLSPPTKIVENAQVLVNKARWSQSKKEDNYNNKKAMTILLASMFREEGGKVQYCILAKEI